MEKKGLRMLQEPSNPLMKCTYIRKQTARWLILNTVISSRHLFRLLLEPLSRWDLFDSVLYGEHFHANVGIDMCFEQYVVFTGQARFRGNTLSTLILLKHIPSRSWAGRNQPTWNS